MLMRLCRTGARTDGSCGCVRGGGAGCDGRMVRNCASSNDVVLNGDDDEDADIVVVVCLSVYGSVSV